MIRIVVLSLVFSGIFVACSDDEGNVSASVEPVEVVVFQKWEENTDAARQAMTDLSVLVELAEKTGELPEFFESKPLMSREERDNVQSGYDYPLYFAASPKDFPSRQWEDGFTLKKEDISNSAEATKLEAIEKDMITFWGQATYDNFFTYLTQFPLLDVRHYSLKKQPPTVSEVCFTVAFRKNRRGSVNYCMTSHRMLISDNGEFPKVYWSMNPGIATDVDAVDAFKLFVTGIAAQEVIFANPNNRDLREIILSNDRLSVQMHEANDKYEGLFDFTLEGENYLNGRQ